jgi:hypothetical protein
MCEKFVRVNTLAEKCQCSEGTAYVNIFSVFRNWKFILKNTIDIFE